MGISGSSLRYRPKEKDDGRLKLRLFQGFYNEERPHSSRGYLTPATYAKRSEGSKTKEELYS